MDTQKDFWQIAKESSILVGIGVIALIVLNFTTDIFKTTNPEPPTCSKEYVNLCSTRDLCEGKGFFWWDNTCHLIEKDEATCSKEFLYLCTSEELCISKNLYWWEDNCHLAEKPEPKPSEYPDYDALEDLDSLVIIENKVSWSPEGNADKIIGDKKEIEAVGQFARIYLYAEASINGKPLTQYESLYIKFNNEGGHLFRPRSLKIPADTITRLLYAVNDVPYLESIPYSESKTPLVTDWFEFFKEDSPIVFNAFISSLRPAKIDKIILYYECVENSNCKIELK